MEESLLENIDRDDEIDDTSTVNEGETPKSQSLQGRLLEFLLKTKQGCSPAILICISHGLSAWGDRMWAFAVGIFLMLLTPNDLRLTAIYGLSVSLSVVVFGTLVGDWVDATPRLKATRLTLIIQNVAVVACSGVLLLILATGISKALFPFLEFLLILLAIIARLSSLGTTIAIERDWVVVIAKEDEALMAGTNAKLRRIDLTCNILAPVLTGVIIKVSSVVGIIFIAVWNILSLFAEYFILSNVYSSCPALAIKAVDARHVSGINDHGSDEEIDLDESSSDGTIIIPQVKTARRLKSTWIYLVENIQHRTRTVLLGFKLYFKQRISLAGLSLATLYLTVLGFDSITTAYAYSQHFDTATLGGLMAAGALTGIIGTFIFPKFRKRFGLVKTGLFSMSIQLFFLMFCVASVWAPGHPGHLLDPSGHGYHEHMATTKTTASPTYTTVSSKRLNISVVTTAMYDNRSIHNLIVLPTLAGFQSTLLQNSTTPVKTSLNYRSTRVVLLKTSSIHPSSAALFAPNTTVSVTINTGNRNASSNTNHRSSNYISLGLLMGGIVMSRIGLWMTDLVITQLFQENIPETERGIVSGVQNSFNNIMDAAHFVLVIVAPKPAQFGALILVSVAMVSLGFAFYARFAWIVRKRLLQLEKLSQWSVSNESVEGSSQRLRRENRRNSQEENMKGILTVENENYSNYS